MATYKLYPNNPRKIRINHVRINYPSLFEKKERVDDDGNVQPGSYSGQFILDPKEHADAIVELNRIMEIAAKEAYGAEQGPRILKGLKADSKTFLRDGNTRVDSQGNLFPELVDKMFFNASSYTTAPRVVDRAMVNGQPVVLTKADADRIYSGSYGNVIIEIYGQKAVGKRPRRINAGLVGYQFWEDGEPIAGGRPADESDFDYSETSDVESTELAADFI